jgi:hypothetical protein
MAHCFCGQLKQKVLSEPGKDVRFLYWMSQLYLTNFVDRLSDSRIRVTSDSLANASKECLSDQPSKA